MSKTYHYSCPRCHKLFWTADADARLCPLCAAHTYQTRACGVCGRKFTPRATNAKFCSDECRRAGKRATDIALRAGQPKMEKRCMECGELLPEDAAKNQQYCSDCVRKRRLAHQAWKREILRQARPPKARTVKCADCGAEMAQLPGVVQPLCEGCKERRQQEFTAARKKVETRVKSSRHCHDCGKATHNYRCPACLAKWRQKHEVTSLEEVGF